MKALSYAVAVAMLGGAFAAQAETAIQGPTIYGKINVTVGHQDEAGETKVAVKSHASRLGVKGGATLTDSLEVIYKLEFGVNGFEEGTDTFSSRNTYAGLKGGFGEVVVGRNDTMLKQSQGGVDLFGDIEGDITALFAGENRIGDTVTYKSPAFEGFQAGATWVTEDSEKTVQKSDGSWKQGASLAAWYGDAKLKKTPFYASVAYDANVKGYKSIARITGYTKINIVQFGGMVQTQKADGGDNKTGYMVNAGVDITPELMAKAQYQYMNDSGKAGSLGLDYKLAKATKVYGYYTLIDKDNVDEDNYLNVGLIHLF